MAKYATSIKLPAAARLFKACFLKCHPQLLALRPSLVRRNTVPLQHNRCRGGFTGSQAEVVRELHVVPAVFKNRPQHLHDASTIEVEVVRRVLKLSSARGMASELNTPG